ncbi:MAG: DUF924 family protein [Caulobacteraceae bacterium]
MVTAPNSISARQPGSILEFWKDAGMKHWFAKDPAFDADFRALFLDDHLAAARRDLDDWANTADGALALLILLDQFPRNAFRGTAHMYATDPLALMFARQFISDQIDQSFSPDLRTFFYLPLTHSEDGADQDLSVALRSMLGPRLERSARLHRDIILEFGRFPHRNDCLGRASSAAELAFLAAGGFAG